MATILDYPMKLSRRVLNRLDLEAGRYLVGNPRGVSRNIQGWAAIRRARRGDYRCPVPLSPEAYALQRDGYVSVGRPYAADYIKSLQKKYAVLLEDDRHSRDHGNRGYPEAARQIIRPSECLPEIADLLASEVIDITQQALGTYLGVSRVQAWRIHALPEEVADATYVFSQWWHCDNRPTSLIKLFVNLSDVGEEDGPFHVQSIARTKRLVRKGYISRTYTDKGDYCVRGEDIDAPEHIVRATGIAGSAFLANTTICMHRAGVPAAGNHRDVACFYLVPSREPLAGDWIRSVGDAEDL